MLFDGDCGICTKLAQKAARIDRRRLFRIHPYYEFTEEELAIYGITYDDCTRSIQLIRPNGKVSRRAFAVNRFLIHYWPWKVLVALMYVIPIFLVFETLGYVLVARNRIRISGWFGLDECKIRFTENGVEPAYALAPAADEDTGTHEAIRESV